MTHSVGLCPEGGFVKEFNPPPLPALDPRVDLVYFT